MERVLYNTHSMCAKCSLVDRRGLEWKPAVVVEKDRQVFLNFNCPHHGNVSTLYCSNSAFFERMLSFSNPLQQPSNSVSDIEDLLSRLHITPQSPNLPLMAEVSVFRSGAWIADDALKNELLHYKSLYPRDCQFLLKLNGGLANDMNVLNSKVKMLLAVAPGLPFLVETSIERICSLAQLPDSCLLHRRVHPSVRYYLRTGDEALCVRELTDMFTVLRQIQQLHVVLVLCVEPPFPDLTSILGLLRANRGLVQYIVLSLERAPRTIMDTLQGNGSSSVDPFALLELVERATNGSVSRDDFFPVSVGRIFEPFLEILGWGKFMIRPSPFCGFATMLVNTADLHSVPVGRLLELNKFYFEMSRFLAETKGKIGWTHASRLNKIVERCTIPDAPVPPLLPYLSESSKAAALNSFLDNLQFIMIHNNMDVASLDYTRRCQCASITHSKATPSGIAATCTGCM
eukprot:gnl/Hemi2/6275_TR2153_c0_g1_i1.p1 gnl/Hemi2/6275_TR2153_c0_g1~~gnl/Hemi2/6275_TR2153_c0_g1_i1.p1  ORF type:complete len:458 (-),score=70.27 gnl/Hemi2/6275_TR2153_c0_g1_i1:75-1448(-)